MRQMDHQVAVATQGVDEGPQVVEALWHRWSLPRDTSEAVQQEGEHGRGQPV